MLTLVSAVHHFNYSNKTVIILQGVDANSTSPSGLPLLSLAAANGHTQCLSVLQREGAKVNGKAERYKTF